MAEPVRLGLDAGERLFVRLALCSLLQRLAVFHEARGHRPIAASRLDRAVAKQDPPAVLGHAADHEFRVLVVDRAAVVADVARQVITLRHLADDR